MSDWSLQIREQIGKLRTCKHFNMIMLHNFMCQLFYNECIEVGFFKI